MLFSLFYSEDHVAQASGCGGHIFCAFGDGVQGEALDVVAALEGDVAAIADVSKGGGDRLPLYLHSEWQSVAIVALVVVVDVQASEALTPKGANHFTSRCVEIPDLCMADVKASDKERIIYKFKELYQIIVVRAGCGRNFVLLVIQTEGILGGNLHSALLCKRDELLIQLRVFLNS